MKNTLIQDDDVRLTKKVYVEWLDSMAIRGWTHESVLTDEYTAPSLIISLGFLIKDTPKYITLSTSISVNGSTTDPISIPKVAITKMKIVKL